MKRLIDMTEPDLQKYLHDMAEMIESVLPGESEPGKGHNGRSLFMLVLFDDPGLAQYVSNTDRTNMIAAMRETADRFERKEILSRVPDGLGATGDFPDGKLHDRDEGGLNMGIGSDKKLGKVLVTFGKPVAWLGLNARDALQMADTLRWHASKIGE